MFRQGPAFHSEISVIRDKRGRDNESQLYFVFVLTDHILLETIYVLFLCFVINYSRTSTARTPMARLPWLIRTRF